MNLDKIIACVVGGIFQGIAVSIIAKKQMESINNKDNIKYALAMIIYGFFSLAFINNKVRLILFIIVSTICMQLIFKLKDRKSIIYSFNSEMLLSLSEIIITVLLVLIGINSSMLVNNYFYNLITNILVSTFSIIIISIPCINKIIGDINKKIFGNKRINKYLFIILISIYLIVSKNGLELVLKSNYYINILFIFSIIFIVVIIIKNELKYDQISEQNKQMLNYVTKYEKIITEQGKANHEFKNQLMVIRGYAQMNSTKLIEYLDSIAEDIKKTHSSYLISNLNKFPDGGIKGLLYYKLSVMDDEKIKYEINVSDGIKSKLSYLSATEYKNITKILGVLLDNAIDANKKCKNKKVIIMVVKDKESVDFKIYNTYKDKIEISKVGTGYTSKGNGHGYGLRLVNDIINNNSNLNIERYLEDNYYVSILHIKNNKKRGCREIK